MLLIRECWYPVLESRELKKSPLGLERLGIKFVFWRSADGTPHGLLDRCPHLGATLNRGKIVNDRLICPFHGYQFDCNGLCTHVPAIGHSGKMPKLMAAQSFPVIEAFGLIWLWWGETRSAYPDPPYFTELMSGWNYGSFSTEWPVHYTRCIENQLDVAHLPFVHRTTIGAGNKTVVEGPYVEADTNSIRVWLTNKFDDGIASRATNDLKIASQFSKPILTLLFPGLWLLNMGPCTKNFIAFVPINDQKTRLYVRIYHKYRFRIVAMLYETLMSIANRVVLKQDRNVVVTQIPHNSIDASNDILIVSDRPIIKFRQLLSLMVNSE